MRNSINIVMSGLAVAGLILLLTFLGHTRSDDDPAGPSVVADETASVTASASKVMDAAIGNPAQREARYKIEAYTLNHPMDVCMAAAGQPDWDALSLTHQAFRMDPMTWSTFFSTPYNHYYSQFQLDTRDAAAREEAAMNDQLTEAEDAAVSKCLESTEGVSDETAEAASTPAIARQLTTKWSRFLSDLDERFSDETAYYDCMKDSDLPWVKWTGDTPEDIARSMHGPGTTYVPGPDTPAADYTDQWRDFLAQEAQLEEADWQCRGEIYETHIAEVATAVDAFAAEHADELAKASQAWEAIATKAANLPPSPGADT